ncbi:DegT/DnrJ/EryC1/StrS family aminotransferase [Halobium salinum]|uniref:DegT/DnrJ/EryC1/StrS family aminotransferase n=1 Tax=Halobium salinum TaxID=1364940 RepID=A0ABD5P9W4_9EURY|nr:DegT/DnrJ/EryC1/StrS family aminotransferase [Halobium salinum]
MPSNIPLFEIPWDEREISNATRSISRGSHWTKGPFVDEFEDRLADYFGVDHALTVNSGTTALGAALKSLGVGRGDKVIVPSFTFVATVNSVQLAGAKPAFADIERETLGLDPESVEAVITDDVVGLLPVHPYGAGCRIEELVDIAADYGCWVLEDAAETFGAEVDGRKLGTFGEAAALSFCQNKVLTTGEGGAIITDDDDLATQIRLYRSHGRASSSFFESAQTGTYVSLGTNIRMPDLIASIGCAQLDKIDDLIGGRQAAAGRLNDGFSAVKGVEPVPYHPNGTNVYQLYSVVLGDGVDRDELIASLAADGVAAKVYWEPSAHQTDYYRGQERYTNVTLPVTEEIASRVLSLPIHPKLTEAETDRVVNAVRKGVENQP